MRRRWRSLMIRIKDNGGQHRSLTYLSPTYPQVSISTGQTIDRRPTKLGDLWGPVHRRVYAVTLPMPVPLGGAVGGSRCQSCVVTSHVVAGRDRMPRGPRQVGRTSITS
jgi:hypothetical protein